MASPPDRLPGRAATKCSPVPSAEVVMTDTPSPDGETETSPPDPNSTVIAPASASPPQLATLTEADASDREKRSIDTTLRNDSTLAELPSPEMAAQILASAKSPLTASDGTMRLMRPLLSIPSASHAEAGYTAQYLSADGTSAGNAATLPPPSAIAVTLPTAPEASVQNSRISSPAHHSTLTLPPEDSPSAVLVPESNMQVNTTRPSSDAASPAAVRGASFSTVHAEAARAKAKAAAQTRAIFVFVVICCISLQNSPWCCTRHCWIWCCRHRCQW